MVHTVSALSFRVSVYHNYVLSVFLCKEISNTVDEQIFGFTSSVVANLATL